MKLKIYVLKKKQLYLTAIILGILIISIILVISIKTSSTLSLLTIPNSYKADINNDGKPDTLVVKENDTTKDYMLNVVCSDNSEYSLEPDPIIHSFGNSNTNIPLKITFMDINKDNSDEIFVQGSDSKGPILNVFEYQNHNVSRIASGRYSFYGLLSNNNNSANTLVLESRQSGKLRSTYLVCEPSGMTVSTEKFSSDLGMKALAPVLSYIEKPDLESANIGIDSSKLSVLSRGKILDGVITNVSYNTDNTPSEFSYNVRVALADNTTAKIENYKIEVISYKNNLQKNDYEIKDILKTN